MLVHMAAVSNAGYLPWRCVRLTQAGGSHPHDGATTYTSVNLRTLVYVREHRAARKSCQRGTHTM